VSIELSGEQVRAVVRAMVERGGLLEGAVNVAGQAHQPRSVRQGVALRVRWFVGYWC
jgi:hypothetical protein